MIKEYILKHKTAKSIAKDNGLVFNNFVMSDNMYFDFSLFNEIEFRDEEEKTIIMNDIMRHQVHFWDQPLPTIIIVDRFCHILGNVSTVYHKIYNKTGKRVMVIVEIVKVELNVEKRESIYSDKYIIVVKYNADNHHSQPALDIEIGGKCK